MAPPADPDALSPVELRGLVSALQGKVVDLERTVAAQREEIARLKGLKARPRIKPSGMEQASEPKPPRGPHGRRGRGKVVPRVAVEDRRVAAGHPAAGVWDRHLQAAGPAPADPGSAELPQREP